MPSGSSNKMLFLLFCKTLLVRLRRHTCSNFHNDTKTLLYLTFVRSHLNMIMLCEIWGPQSIGNISKDEGLRKRLEQPNNYILNLLGWEGFHHSTMGTLLNWVSSYSLCSIMSTKLTIFSSTLDAD